MRRGEGDALLDLIEREYEAFRRHHAAAQTRESPGEFARLFREWMAPHVIGPTNVLPKRNAPPAGQVCPISGTRLDPQPWSTLKGAGK